jgi:hypothetical protein
MFSGQGETRETKRERGMGDGRPRIQSWRRLPGERSFAHPFQKELKKNNISSFFVNRFARLFFDNPCVRRDARIVGQSSVYFRI